jgi:hypothetical protein
VTITEPRSSCRAQVECHCGAGRLQPRASGAVTGERTLRFNGGTSARGLPGEAQ